MSKIQETANKMKKKMSFNDYEKPDAQTLAGKDATQQTSIPASQHNSLPEESNIDLTEQIIKNKVTFYLDEDTQDKLDEIEYKRKKDRRKSTKSGIVCEAINMLYKKEIN